MKRYRLTIRTRIDAHRVRVRMLDALARSAADALISILDQLPQGSLVTVRPA